MTEPSFKFPHFHSLYENDAFLAIHKPAGLVCHPTKKGPNSSLIDQIRRYLNPDVDFESMPMEDKLLGKQDDLNLVQPRMINRLDRETSGILLVAKTAEAASELGKFWESKGAVKTYWALVSGWVEYESGVIHWPLGPDEASEVAVKDRVRPDGAPSMTAYRVLSRFLFEERRMTWVEVQPKTGKKHQIRIHLSELGHSIIGDKLYGIDSGLYLKLAKGTLTDEDRIRLIAKNQALHAVRLEILFQEEPIQFTSMPETEFLSFLPKETLQKVTDEMGRFQKIAPLAQPAILPSNKEPA
jgi:23S rRNA pseudouridine1911/1915/1917 synthase